jgi:hypothetical protein
MPAKPEAAQRTRQIRVTDEQFKAMFDADPHNPEFQAEMCRDALYTIHVPNQTGVWPKYGARVYYDNGFQGSGYLLVHWNDASKVPGCLSNGYCPSGGPGHEDIVWDDQPERERLASIRQTLWDRAYA